MTSNKMKIEIARCPTPEQAAQLVDALKAENSALWERWVELEKAGGGVEEIAPEIFKFISRSVDWSDSLVPGSTLVAMRQIAMRLAVGEKSVPG